MKCSTKEERRLWREAYDAELCALAEKEGLRVNRRTLAFHPELVIDAKTLKHPLAVAAHENREKFVAELKAGTMHLSVRMIDPRPLEYPGRHRYSKLGGKLEVSIGFYI